MLRTTDFSPLDVERVVTTYALVKSAVMLGEAVNGCVFPFHTCVMLAALGYLTGPSTVRDALDAGADQSNAREAWTVAA